MKSKRPVLRTAAVILCLFLMMGGLSGCKYSPRLHEMIQDRFNHLLDTKSAKEFENDFNRVETTDQLIPKQKNRKSKRKNIEEKTTPVESEEPQETNSETVPKLVLQSQGETAAAVSEEKNHHAAAPSGAAGKASSDKPVSGTGSVIPGTPGSSGSGSGSPSGGGGGQGSGGGTGESGSGTGGEGQGGTGSGGTGDQGTDVEPGPDGKRPVVDNRGDLENVPEEVSSVACPGASAAFFCAVGGEGLIRASSESFASSAYLDRAVGAGIQPLWSGEGTGMMSESQFASLLSLKPEVVVEISGFSTLSDEQITQLMANEISYSVLPVPDSLDNIRMAVRLAGKMTGKGGRTGNGNELASQYSEYADRLASDIQSKVRSSGFSDLGESEESRYNGKCSLYIEGWDPDVVYSIGIIAGNGVAYTGNNRTSSFRLMNALMDIGGVYNKMNRVDDVRANQLWVTPIKSNGTDKLNVTLGARALKATTKSLLEYNSRILLGSEAVPGVIVRDQATAMMIASDRLWEVGSEVSASSMTVNGFYTNESGTAIAGSSVEAPFEMFVNPCGLSTWDGLSQSGSWVGGSPESILESAWIASCFFESSYSRGDLENEIKEFYSRFYGMNLSGEQVASILAGRAG